MARHTPDAPAAPGAAPRPPRTLPDRLLGAVGGAMVVGALVVLLFGGEGDTGAGAPQLAAAPQLLLVEPGTSDTIAADAPLVFRSARELRLAPAGWGVDSLHVHASINGRDVMPAGPDITRGADGTYVWRLRRLPDGPVRLRLYWSGPDHRPIGAGASEEIGVFVR